METVCSTFFRVLKTPLKNSDSTTLIVTNQDSFFDFIDLDSDGDNCFDVIEAEFTGDASGRLSPNYLDVDNNGADEYYYSQWDVNTPTNSINDFYEYAKWLTRDGSSDTLYGLSGELIASFGVTIFDLPE